MKKWTVLPTDQRFRDLTDDQIDWLFFDGLIDDPERMRLYENYTNKDFMNRWERVQNGEDVDISDIGWKGNLQEQFQKMCEEDPIDKSLLSDYDHDKYEDQGSAPSVEEVKQIKSQSQILKQGHLEDESKWEEVE